VIRKRNGDIKVMGNDGDFEMDCMIIRAFGKWRDA